MDGLDLRISGLGRELLRAGTASWALIVSLSNRNAICELCLAYTNCARSSPGGAKSCSQGRQALESGRLKRKPQRGDISPTNTAGRIQFHVAPAVLRILPDMFACDDVLFGCEYILGRPATCDSLTVNAAYPSCQPNFRIFILWSFSPLRRIRFDFCQHFGNRDRRFDLRKDVDVVADSTDFQLHAAFGADDSADVAVEFLLKFVCRLAGFDPWC